MKIIGTVTSPDKDNSVRDLYVEIMTQGYDTYPIHIRLEGDSIPLEIGAKVEVEGDLRVLTANSGKSMYRIGTFASVQLAMRVTNWKISEERESFFEIY